MHPYSIDSLEREKVLVALALLAVALGYLTHAVLSKFSIDLPWYLDTPSIGGYYALLRGGFEWIFWRIRIGRFGLSKIPIFSGPYVGTLRGNFNGKMRSADIDVVIKQSWSLISIQGQTPSSTASSTMASVSIDDRSFRYEFWDEPVPAKINARPAHRGVSFYKMKKHRALSGGYYTHIADSKTGSINLRRAKKSNLRWLQ